MASAALPGARRSASVSALRGQATPSAVMKLRPSAARRSWPSLRSALTRPCNCATAKGWALAAKRKATARKARSTVAATGSPRRTSIQARTAPSPSVTSKGNVTWRRNSATSVRGRATCRVPFQRRQSPLASNSDCVKRPCSVKRSPQAAGGVASRRRSWRRRPLRSTRSTLPSSSAAPPCCSSIQRRRPLRTTTSCCEKNQSVAPPASRLPLRGTSMPATKMRPALSRRTSRAAPSMCSCSKRSSNASSERADTAALTLGRRSASRRWGSCSTTSVISSAGTQPLERTWIAPMATGTPRTRLARASICGRHCSMRGRIAQCSVSHASSNRLQAAITRPNAVRHSSRSPGRRRRSTNAAAGTAAGGEDTLEERAVGWATGGPRRRGRRDPSQQRLAAPTRRHRGQAGRGNLAQGPAA